MISSATDVQIHTVYLYVVLTHTIYIYVLHRSLMVMDSPSCGHCAGHGGGGNNFGSCDLSCDKLKGHSSICGPILRWFSLACTFECNSQSCVCYFVQYCVI